ncbi:hypothetical protein F5Y16DRAFT_401190 [Xylariaceae sp. FL0255]|nr:hypothetical protein F5Y16DRAFT_401190 [Xylariaceae sp. FL0255]
MTTATVDDNQRTFCCPSGLTCVQGGSGACTQCTGTTSSPPFFTATFIDGIQDGSTVVVTDSYAVVAGSPFFLTANAVTLIPRNLGGTLSSSPSTASSTQLTTTPSPSMVSSTILTTSSSTSTLSSNSLTTSSSPPIPSSNPSVPSSDPSTTSTSPLEVSSSNSTTSYTSSSQSTSLAPQAAHQSKNSKTIKLLIIIISVVSFLLLSVLVSFLVVRHRRKRTGQKTSKEKASDGALYLGLKPELDASAIARVELDGTTIGEHGSGIYFVKPELEGSQGSRTMSGVYVKTKAELDSHDGLAIEDGQGFRN